MLKIPAFLFCLDITAIPLASEMRAASLQFSVPVPLAFQCRLLANTFGAAFAKANHFFIPPQVPSVIHSRARMD